MNVINNSFYRLFYKREFGVILGKRKSNLVILALMLFIAFTAIGFAEGSLRYLEFKMKDPFINWVNVLPGGKSSHTILRIIDELNSPDVKETYALNSALGYNRYQLNFYYHDDVLNYYAGEQLDTNRIAGFPGRTMNVEDPVISEVFSSKNHIDGDPFHSELDIGLIVTEDMLQRLNYPVNTPYVWIDFPAFHPGRRMEQIRVAVPVPVRAVVKVLPGLTNFATTPYFFQQRMIVGNNPFNPLDDERLLLSVKAPREEANAYLNALERHLRAVDLPGSYMFERAWIEPDIYANDQSSFILYVIFSPRNISMDHLDEIFNKLYNHNELADYQGSVFRMYDYASNLGRLQRHGTYDRISLHFKNLDKLREFSVMLSTLYQIEVDMAQIESRENYNFVSRLTGIISFVLIAFSILSVLLFTAHLLKKHLEGIKRNLGTFKAFGLSNNLLINIYVKLVLLVLGSASLLALAASTIFGYSGGMRLVLEIFGSHFERGLYFSLFSSYLLIALALLIIFSVTVLRFVTIKILNRTPGDLIYERQSQGNKNI